jgi:multiple sugar transport system substrate-binding protein
MYIKNLKKSIYQVDKKDLFLVLVILILIITPLIINLSFNTQTVARQFNLYISPNFEELFGIEVAEKLLQEFMEQNPDVMIRTSTTGPDILLLKNGSFGDPIIPLVSFMDLLFYNIDVLTAAGFDRPPKTRDEFTAYARTVSQGDFGASGAAVSLSQNDRRALSRDVFSWIWAAGGNFWPDGDRPSLDSRLVINDLAFLGTLYREGLLAPDVFETTGEQRLEQFAQGKIAMMVASTHVIPYLRERMGDSAFGITTIPDQNTGGIYSINISSIYAGINADSVHPEEIWGFVEFLAEKSSFFCAELKAVPGTVSGIIPGDYVIDDPFYSKAWDVFESAYISEGFSGKPGAQEFENAFLEELRIFFETDRTAQQTVNAIVQRWDAIE